MKPDVHPQKIPREAIKAWRIGSLWSLLVWIVPLFLFAAYARDTLSGWFVLASAVLALLFMLIMIVIIPKMRWREWYYHIDEHEIELQNGIIIVEHTLIPVNRVQHVDTRQGPVLSSFNLADVVISTAATRHKIPALDVATADEVRKRISAFARKAREDV